MLTPLRTDEDHHRRDDRGHHHYHRCRHRQGHRPLDDRRPSRRRVAAELGGACKSLPGPRSEEGIRLVQS